MTKSDRKMGYLSRSIMIITLLILFFLIVTHKEAYAYIDPGTGSYIIQLIIAAILGGMFAIKTFWKHIKTFFANLFLSQKDKKDNE